MVFFSNIGTQDHAFDVSAAVLVVPSMGKRERERGEGGGGGGVWWNRIHPGRGD